TRHTYLAFIVNMQASDLRMRRFLVDLTDNSPRKQQNTNRLRKSTVIILKYCNPSVSGHNLENRAFGIFDLGHSWLLSICKHTTVSAAGLPIPSKHFSSTLVFTSSALSHSGKGKQACAVRGTDGVESARKTSQRDRGTSVDASRSERVEHTQTLQMRGW